MIFEDLGLLFFTALIMSLLLTPASITFAKYIGAVDLPVARSVHTQVMPRMGGLGMAIAAAVALLMFVKLEANTLGLLVGVGVIVLTGMLDDVLQISPAKKMMGQIVACLAFLLLSDLSIHTFGDLFGLGSLYFQNSISLFITLFCMLGIINAFNLSDGLDGLAAGITFIASVFLAVLALLSHNWAALFVIVALVGSVLGFLKFNTHPAKLFMGDTGSLSLGFFIACLVVFLIDFDGKILVEPITLALILALPIMDTLVVMTTRIMHGQSPVSADKTHLHHRLLDIGLSHAAVVVVMYSLAVLFGLLAMAVHAQEAWIQLMLGLLLCAFVYIALMMCEKCDLQLKSKLESFHLDTDLQVQLASKVGKSLSWLRFVILLGLLLPLPFVHSAPEGTLNLLMGVFVLLLLAFPWLEHKERLNIVYALFYMAGLTILYVWNVSEYNESFSMNWYTWSFVFVLTFWSILKIRFKGHREVFLTSGLEILLIFFSWFVPYTLLPVLQVSEDIMMAVKVSCLEAIPLFIAIKIVVRRQPDRNRLMALGLLMILFLMAVTL